MPVNLNYLDIIFIVILVSYVFSAMKRGLMLSLFDVCSVFLATIITSQFYPRVAEYIRTKTPLYEWFKELLEGVIRHSDAMRQQGIDLSLNLNRLELSKSIIESIQLPTFIKALYNKIVLPQVDEIFDVKGLLELISGRGAYIFLNIVAMIITFAVVSVILNILSRFLSIVSFLPFLNIVNAAGGAVIGFVQGTLCLWFICSVMALIIERPECRFLKDSLLLSSVAIKFYDSNILLRFLIQFIRGLAD